jgi:pimeloyl-ACP methyl ester carboxylesterase
MTNGDPTRRAFRALLPTAKPMPKPAAGRAAAATPIAVVVQRPARRRWRWLARSLLALVALCVLTLGGFRLAAALRETATVEQLAPRNGQFITTPDGRLFLQDVGPRDGVPVVLIHGTAAWSEFWRGTMDHLTGQGYRVIAVDLPPFGFSDRASASAYTRAHQARRLAAALDALAIDRAIFVGHSFGAGATVELVMRFPERVRGLVLVAGALGLPDAGQPITDPPAWLLAALDLPILPAVVVAATATNPLLTERLLGTMVARKEAATPALADILRRPMTRVGTTPDFARWVKAFLTPDRTAWSMQPEAYGRIAAPTRLIWGDLDTLTPLPQGERLASLIPAAKLELMRGVGHIPQIEDPAAFRPLLVKLLGELR